MLKTQVTVLSIIVFASMQLVQAQMAFRYGGDSSDYGKAIARDEVGNIIVAGSFSKTVDFDPGIDIHSYTAQGNIDVFIAKYNAGGAYLWVISIGGTGIDAVNAVKTDGGGNIYICGSFYGQVDFDPGVEIVTRISNGLSDAYVAKYDPNGNFLWVNTVGSDSLDETMDLVVDPSSNVYCIGYFQHTVNFDTSVSTATLVSNGVTDAFLVKYNSMGVYQWSAQYGGVGEDKGQAIALDNDQNCYVAGYISIFELSNGSNLMAANSPVNNTSIFLSKYSSSGNLNWTKFLRGGGFNFTSPGCLQISPDEQLNLAGCFSDTLDVNPSFTQSSIIKTNGWTDIFVSRYTLDGLYSNSFNFGGPSNDRVTGIAVNIYNEVVMTGLFRGSVDFNPKSGVYTLKSNGTGDASDIFTARYSSQGDLFWVNGIGASTSTSTDVSTGSAVIFDGADNCYVAGSFCQTADFDPAAGIHTLSSAGASDVFMTEYDTYGNLSLGEYPTISISKLGVDFYIVAVDSTKPDTLMIANNGTLDLIVRSVTLTNPTFTVSPTSLIVGPSDSARLIIAFTPNVTLPQTGWIILQHNASTGQDSVAVQGSGTLAIRHVDYQLAAGWNMISVPIEIANASKNYLFSSSISAAYFFNGSAYQSLDTLQKSVGYWLKFDSSRLLSRFGLPITSDTISVTEGWNLIGSIFSAVNVDAIIQDPPENAQSSFFEYDGGYKPTTIIKPGKAYWVKAKQTGIFILNTP
jgi:hypothetical protein